MKHLTKWLLGLIAVAGIAGFSGSSAQDGGGKRTIPSQIQGKQGKKAVKKPGKAGAKAIAKGMNEKMGILRKVLPTMKTSLGEAIALAEKESGGKAFSSEIQVGKDGKPSIHIALLANDLPATAIVDPETKKVTLKSAGPKTKPAGEERPAGDGPKGGGDGKGGK